MKKPLALFLSAALLLLCACGGSSISKLQARGMQDTSLHYDIPKADQTTLIEIIDEARRTPAHEDTVAEVQLRDVLVGCAFSDTKRDIEYVFYQDPGLLIVYKGYEDTRQEGYYLVSDADIATALQIYAEAVGA